MLGLRTKKQPPKTERPFNPNIVTYEPQDLGFYLFPEMKKIYVGDCGSTDIHYYTDPRVNFVLKSPLGWTFGAHTHTCVNDPLVSCICVSNDDIIIEANGDPTDLMWHEYVHCLMIARVNPIFARMTVTCMEDCIHNYHYDPRDEEAANLWTRWGETGHGTLFIEIAKEIGQEHITQAPFPNVNPPQQMAQAAAFVKRD